METTSVVNFSNKEHTSLLNPFNLEYKTYDSWQSGCYFFVANYKRIDEIDYIDELRKNNVFLIITDVLEGWPRRRFEDVQNFVEENNLQNKVYFATSLLSTKEEYDNWTTENNKQKIFSAFYYPEWYHRVYNNLYDFGLQEMPYEKENYFCCLNNRQREHRKKFVDALIQDNLLSQGWVSSTSHQLQLDGVGSRPHDFNSAIYEKCLINVITETFYEQVWNKTGNIFFSEKTWKPIVCKQAFIMIGPKYSLQYLKELGFRTFDFLWDESYDTAEDEKRLYLAANSLYNAINSYSIEELNKATLEVRIHNLNQFKNIKDEMVKTCW